MQRQFKYLTGADPAFSQQRQEFTISQRRHLQGRVDSLIGLGMQCPNFKNKILDLQLFEINKHRKKKQKKKKLLPKDASSTL